LALRRRRRPALTGERSWLNGSLGREPLLRALDGEPPLELLLGRGIIDPVDDIRSSNPASNPELLAALTDDFVKSGFDLRRLMRTIVRSRVYQQSLATSRWNRDDAINFSHAVPRRLTAEQLLDAISIASGSPQKFEGMPVGFRAAQLPDSRVAAGGFLGPVRPPGARNAV